MVPRLHRAVAAFAAAALLSISTVVALAGPASALDPATLALHVDDEGDDTGNDCATPAAPCQTVTHAVARAHTAISGGAVDVTVDIAAGTYVENVAIGDVASGHSLSLVGADAATTVIDGLGTAAVPASVISITSGTVEISGLSILGGVAVDGGGIHNGSGTVTVSDSVVSGNASTGTTATSGGGGIFNHSGTLTVTESTVSVNTAARYGGGIYNNTAGIVTVSDSTVSNNTGFYSGGIYNGGVLTVAGSTISDNVASNNFGGGLTNYGGTMTVSGSTFLANSANNANTGKGGGIYNRGPATVTNSTFSGNTAYQGGAISNRSELTVTYSTFSGNTATDDNRVPSRGGGLYQEAGAGITVSNSILSQSKCNLVSTLADGGYNVGDASCFYVPAGTSVVNSTTIGLSSLAANGSTGPKTMAIGVDSSAHHLVPTCTGLDQRGIDRPGFGGTAGCDAGAYELQGVAPAVTTDPESQSVAIGSDATFTAAATGTPSPSVQWQVDTGDGWTDVTDATATSLTLPDVTHAMSGHQYRAVFTNGVVPSATTAAATLTVPVGALDHLVLSPPTASVAPGGSQTYTAEGFDAHGNSLGDLTASTVFTGSPGVQCSGTTCAPTSPASGSHTITGTVGSATGTAILTVPAGDLHHLALSPSSATVVAGGSQPYTAQGRDRHDNNLGDLTSATTFAGSPGLECADGSCTSTVPGTYTVTGTKGRAAGTATLTVVPAPVAHLVLSPASATLLAGDAQVLTAEGFDSFGNGLGDVTGSTVFTGSPGLECTASACTSTGPGTYTVTGTNGPASGTATLTVQAKRQAAVVTEVVDGDTLVVRLVPDGPEQRVQLIGAAAPGGNDCWGTRSSKAARKLVPAGTRVVLVADRSQQLEDATGQLLRYVMKGSRDVNRTLVARGHARVSVDRANPFQRVAKYRKAQKRAKRQDEGLWGACERAREDGSTPGAPAPATGRVLPGTAVGRV